jgi:thiosulfate/3-mercaptopyruvate sulfurtransferase
MNSGPLLTAPVVSTQWLADHLGSDKLVVLDATVLPYVQPNGRSGYLSGYDAYLVEGHIPGSVFADVIEVFSDPNGAFPFTRPDAALFEAAAASVGVDNDTTVVVYDAAVGQWASRVWWLFRAFGYDNVAVLDGGFTKWKAEERGSDLGHVQPVEASFSAAERPELWVDKAFVEGVIAGTESAALVCGLPPQEFNGEAGQRSRLGHIPGSVSAPAGRLLDRATNALLPASDLSAKFGPALDADRIVTYCAGGVAAAADALALTLLGHRNVAIYDNSLNEWVSDEAAPVVVGA